MDVVDQLRLYEKRKKMADEKTPKFRYNPVNPDAAWDAELFKEKYGTYQRLEQLDPSSFDYFREIFGDELGKSLYTQVIQEPHAIAQQKFNTQKQTNSFLTENALIGFGRNHPKDLADLVDEEEIIKIPLVYGTYGMGNEKYNAAVSQIKETKDELDESGLNERDEKKRAEKQNAYVKSKLKGYNDYEKTMLLIFADNLYKAYITAAQSRLRKIIKDYGTKDFVTDMVENAGKSYDVHVKELEGLVKEKEAEEKELTKKQTEEIKGLGENPEEDEVNKIREKYKELGKQRSKAYEDREKELAKRYENASEVYPLMIIGSKQLPGLEWFAYDTILQKEAEKKKAEEEPEEAKEESEKKT